MKGCGLEGVTGFGFQGSSPVFGVFATVYMHMG